MTNASRKPQSPVFFLEDFNIDNEDHRKGILTLRLNRRHAEDLCRLIRESDLDEGEGHIYAMYKNIRRWYDTRKDNLRKKAEKEAEKTITIEEAIQKVEKQIPEK